MNEKEIIAPWYRVNTDQLLTTNESNIFQDLMIREVPAIGKFNQIRPNSLFARLDIATNNIMRLEFNV